MPDGCVASPRFAHDWHFLRASVSAVRRCGSRAQFGRDAHFFFQIPDVVPHNYQGFLSSRLLALCLRGCLPSAFEAPFRYRSSFEVAVCFMRCLWGFLQISSRPRRILGANVFAAMGARLADASRAFGRPHSPRRLPDLWFLFDAWSDRSFVETGWLKTCAGQAFAAVGCPVSHDLD